MICNNCKNDKFIMVQYDYDGDGYVVEVYECINCKREVRIPIQHYPLQNEVI